jgi:Tol biopolymer transport system component
MTSSRTLRSLVSAVGAGMLVVPFMAGASAAPARTANHAGLQVASRGSSADRVTNGRIAFSTGFILPDPDLSGHSQVFTVNPDGSGERQLTHVPAGSQAGGPGWSPDGTKIAYASNVSGNFAIWVMNADGSGQHRIAGASGYDYFTPRWSPDGSHLVVARCDVRLGFDSQCDIDVIRSDGSGLRTVVGGHRINSNPEYSPNGRRIAFQSDRAGLVSAVWVVNVSGTGLKRLTKPTLEAQYPQWSPDGGQILLTSNFLRPTTQLFLIRPDGSHLKQLTHAPSGHSEALGSFSPDSRRIVLISDLAHDNGSNDLFTMQADGTHLTKIVANHPRVALSDWGPAH